MTTRNIEFGDWFKAMKKHAKDDDDAAYKNLSGRPVANAASKLGVSRARIYQMIEEDKLDVLNVTNGGRVSMSLVTFASLERYLDERVPDRNRQGFFAFAK